MAGNNSESAKKLSVTLDESITEIPTYDLTLIRGTSEYMEVQLATKTETDTEINVSVESIFRIGKQSIPHFARQFSKYLQELMEKQKTQEQSGT